MKNTYNTLERCKKYMDINFEYYKIFYFVAKYRNITKAAAALGSNQPNVTRIMKLLENQLGCRLFIREARGVSLTEEGERLFSHVQIAYDHLLSGEREISYHEADGEGTVEIGATETALHLLLLDALGEFRAKYPKIRIKIHNHTTLEILKYLVSGRLDFAVITTPFDAAKSFRREELLVFQEILVGGRQYGSFEGKVLELKGLKDFSWIGLGRGSVTYDFYRNFFIEHEADIELDMEVATSDLMIPLIRNNLGIGFVPEALAQPLLDRKELVRLDFGFQAPARAVEIIYDRRQERSVPADAFYRYLKNR